MKKWLVISTVSLVVLGAAAFGAYRMYLNEAHDDAIKLVPPNALIYSNVFLNPSTHQKQALRDLLEKFPGAGTPDEAHSTLERYLDDALAGTGVDFSNDIEPWLDRELAVAVIPPLPADDLDVDPNVIGYIGTTDGDASMSVVNRINERQGVGSDSASYKGFGYEIFDNGDGVAGVLGDFLVIASNETSFKKAIDAHEGESLAGAEAYRNATSALPDDRIALFYAALPRFLTELEASGDVPANAEDTVPQLRALKPIAAAAWLRPDGVVLEAAIESGLADSHPDGVLGMVPKGSWGAVGVHDLGSTIGQRLALLAGRGVLGGLGSAAIAGQIEALTGLRLQDDVLSWMGDAAAFVEGKEQPPRGGVVVESKDPQSSASAVYRLGRALAAQGVPAGVGDHDPTHSTVAFADPSLPTLIQLIAVPERVWFLYGAETAREIDSATLADSPAFRAAESAMGDFSVVGYLDVDGARVFAENTYIEVNGALPESYTEGILPNLQPVSFVGLGTRTTDGVTSYRLMIGVE
jgi:hypothetical protein